MRIFAIMFALMFYSSLAQAGDLTCWYDSEGMNTGADSGNVAHAEDGWRIVDVSHWDNEHQTSAMYIYLGDDDRSLNGGDCPDTLGDVDDNGYLSYEDRPR